MVLSDVYRASTVQAHSISYPIGVAMDHFETSLRDDVSARYGFSELELHPLEEGNQKLFDVRYRKDGCYGRAELRIYFDWVDRTDVEAETEWLSALSADTNLRVPNPISALDGTFIQDLHLGADSKLSVSVLQT